MSASPVGCIWCGVRLSKPTLARRDGKVWALSYLGTTYARAEEAEADPRIDRGQGPILGVLGAGRMGSRAWKGGTGRAWGRENGTEEERGNLRDMKKQPKTNASINHQIR